MNSFSSFSGKSFASADSSDQGIVANMPNHGGDSVDDSDEASLSVEDLIRSYTFQESKRPNNVMDMKTTRFASQLANIR